MTSPTRTKSTPYKWKIQDYRSEFDHVDKQEFEGDLTQEATLVYYTLPEGLTMSCS